MGKGEAFVQMGKTRLQNKKINKMIRILVYIVLLCVTVYIAAALSINILNTYQITDFSERIISLASKSNIDVGRGINRYYIYFLVCCPLIIFFLCKLLKNFSFILGKIKYIIECILNIIFM